MEDDSEADVEDEVDNGPNQSIKWYQKHISVIQNLYLLQDIDDLDDLAGNIEDEKRVAESQVSAEQFVVLNSYPMNFQAGKGEVNYWSNDVADGV